MRSRNLILGGFLALCLVLLAGCSSLQTPHSVNGTAAYGVATLTALKATAVNEYPYMSKAQATKVHQMLAQATAVRDEALAAVKAGNVPKAQSKLQMLANMLTQLQAAMNKVPSHG